MFVNRVAALTLAAMAAVTLTAMSAQATTFPAHGGQGDRAEAFVCPNGYILSGFHGRGASWIDQVGLICSRVLPGYGTGHTARLKPKGGSGGGPIENYCDRDGGIRSIRVHVAYDDGRPKVVYAIDFSCQRPKDGSAAGQGAFQGNLVGTANADDWQDFDQACPGNEYATGLSLRYGRGVNAAGLICGPVTVYSSPFGSIGGGAGNAGNAGNAGQAVEPGMENNTDRPGSDYSKFNPTSPEDCRSECLRQRDRCKAWTFVRPGVQGARAQCYLKNAVPKAYPNNCCISGVAPDKGRGGVVERPDGGFAPPAGNGPQDQPTSPPPVTQPNYPPPTSPSSPARCIQGFVWREARPTDYVCVTPESRAMVRQENAVASTRWDTNGAYGPYTCIAGFVWREAFDGDVVCVTPERRAAVKEENRMAASRTVD